MSRKGKVHDGKVVRGTVWVAAIAAAAASVALGAMAATTLLEGANGRQVVAAGEDGIVPAAPVAHEPVTAPQTAGQAEAPATPVTQITPGRNPPLMAVGSSSDKVRELQVRLGHLDLFDATVTGYFGDVTKGAVAAYQESKGVDASGEVYPDLWATLQSETPAPTQEELYPPPPETDPPVVDPGSLDPRCLTGRAICADQTERIVRWVVNGRVLLEMDARFGRDSLPTREGQFAVYWKSRDHHSELYDVDMPLALFFSGGEAVHYSADFAAHGYEGGGSHGCINTRDYDGMSWLFDQANVGDKVVVYRS